MCLILCALDVHPDYPLVIAANRDEFHSRPSSPAGFWPDYRQVYAGRDQERGGTWLGITTGGRIAMITNVRQRETQGRSQTSRGLLVSDFLTGRELPDAYLEQLAEGPDNWQGFNLLVGQGDQLCYWSNRGPAPSRLRKGVYGLSNHLLDTPWPKVQVGRSGVERALTRCHDERSLTLALFELLADRSPFPDDRLPETGFGLDWERLLAPLFICSADYGTRCSTVVLFTRRGEAAIVERSFTPDGAVFNETAERFRLP